MIVDVGYVLGSKKYKIAGVMPEKQTKGPTKGSTIYRVCFELVEGDKYADELWLSEQGLIKLLNSALCLNNDK